MYNLSSENHLTPRVKTKLIIQEVVDGTGKTRMTALNALK